MKKPLTTPFSLVLVCGLLPAAAFAETTADTTPAQAVKALHDWLFYNVAYNDDVANGKACGSRYDLNGLAVKTWPSADVNEGGFLDSSGTRAILSIIFGAAA